MRAAKFRGVRRSPQHGPQRLTPGQRPGSGMGSALRMIVPSTDTAPRCSVVIPTYNRAHSVGDAIASVLRQTMADLECIVGERIDYYNRRRRHSALGNRAPLVYLASLKARG